jgi:hypothetical protein
MDCFFCKSGNIRVGSDEDPSELDLPGFVFHVDCIDCGKKYDLFPNKPEGERIVEKKGE